MKIYPQNKEQTRGVQVKFSIIIMFLFVLEAATSMVVLYTKCFIHYHNTNIIIFLGI